MKKKDADVGVRSAGEKFHGGGGGGGGGGGVGKSRANEPGEKRMGKTQSLSQHKGERISFRQDAEGDSRSVHLNWSYLSNAEFCHHCPFSKEKEGEEVKSGQVLETAENLKKGKTS